jgi:hypothetical protein
MAEMSSDALFIVRPSLPATTATVVFGVVGVILLVVAGLLGFVVFAGTGSAVVGIAVAGGLWALGMLAFAHKTRQNINDARYEFHHDRVVFHMRDKIEALDYDKIGHVLFKSGQTFLFSRGFDGLTPLGRMRVDVQKEQGTTKFREIVEIIRNAHPEHLFSYESYGNSRVEYSRPVTLLPGIEDRRVSSIKTIVGRPAYNENEIVIDGADEPAFTVLQPYNPERRYYHRALVLIRNDGQERTGPILDGEALVGFAGTDVSKQLGLEWTHSDIVTGSGVCIGHFRIKNKVISPIDDFELQVLGDTLKLRGDLRDKHYTLTLNDSPVGRMTSRFWNLTKVNEAVFDSALDLKLALCLALAMNNNLCSDADDA